ncbi:riboflavin synthase [Leptolyngbya sp. PCC 6406]|uniref:riboflavin synthase n=1 Tax=Leptolyngbya sp. PCC 6406 TaxID=1173264 RepID=UPI0002ACE071|nr:riboflavin synthase [Leptolyngbya sp. PCC 6406]
MFTGLVQTIGALTPLGPTHLRVEWSPQIEALGNLDEGDSVAVDGVCLTVESCLGHGFIATASPETLQRSTLGLLESGARVNLEDSLRVGSKIGGHFVTGHVDGLGYLESAIATATSWEIRFRVPDPTLARYIVPKGSIAVNGISLTVADCCDRGTWFTVAVIPVTYRETTLQDLQPGQAVNLEGDILGKYVEKFLRLGPAAATDAPDISMDFLTHHGYL